MPEEAILYSCITGLDYLQLIGRLRRRPLREVDRKADDLLDLFSLHPRRHAPIMAADSLERLRDLRTCSRSKRSFRN
ncbi:MAG: hypothetical protein ABSB88_23235 [Bryobacteraceae bacterium]